MSEEVYKPLVTNTLLDQLPYYVEVPEEYPKINLTTIHQYKFDRDVRALMNVTVVGRMNNLKVAIAYQDDCEFIRQAAAEANYECRELTTAVKDFKIEMLEENAMKGMILDIHKAWSRMRVALDDHQKDYHSLEQSIGMYKKRFGRIEEKLDCRLSLKKH